MAQVPAVAQCPEPVETATLHFKSLSKVKVFNAEGHFSTNTSLVAVSQNSGLTFVGTLNGFIIYKSKYVFIGGTSADQYRREVVLNSRTTHLATDFEDNHLAVACQTKMGPIIYIYNIPSFLTKGVMPIKTVPLSNSFQVSQLCELLWQPNSENGLTVCFTDGSVSTLSLFQGSGNDIFSLPSTTQARCLCWSPKGKQIVIGCSDGSLSQYKPDLKFVKKLSPPPLFNGAVTIVNVHWISNFQFLAAYKEANKQDDFPILVIVNAPKNEPIRFINYDDITYSSVHFRPHQFYFYHLMAWNLIFVASANSMEVAVLHLREDNLTWEQWLLGDASRAELPLNSQKSETFPLGMSFDYTSGQAIPWGEESLPPMPRLLMLSNEGLLITFNIINTVNSNVSSQLCSENRKFIDDSWFATKEKSPDTSVTPKMSQSIESVPSQPFPSSHLSFSNMWMTPQDSVITSTGTLNMKAQPPKQQTQIVPPVQQQTQPPQMPQPQIQPAATSIFQTPNSSKWSQKPQFSFSLPPNSGTTAEIAPASKPNDMFKSVEQSVNFFATKPAVAPQPTPPAETKDTSGPVTPQKSMPSSAIITPPVSEQFSSTPVSADAKSNRKRTPETSPSRGTPEIAAVDDSVYVTALWDEIDHFNAELKEVISRVSALRVQIGTDEEKGSLRTSIEKLNKFQNSLNETTTAQKSEIHALKSDVMEAFAWMEDARSRNRQRKSPAFIELKKSQDLDPLCSRLLTEINHLKYYIENQLKQLCSYLMKEWMEHQDTCRLDIKTMMTIPSMEELYKTMHLELKILSKQRAIVEDLKRRMKERNMRNRGDSSMVTGSVHDYSSDADKNRISELFKLADNLLQIKIDRDEEKDDLCVTDAFKLMVKNQMKAIGERSKKFTPEKQNVLRDILTEREMLKTRSVKSNFTSSSFIRNASSRIYSKALLMSKLRAAEKSAAADTEGKLTLEKSEVATKEPEPSPLPETPKSEKPVELFTFSVAKTTPVRPPSAEKEVSSEQKTTPFVFKAAPVSPIVSTVCVTKSAPSVATTTTAPTGFAISSPVETVTVCSGGSSQGGFTFKFVPSTPSVEPNFSFAPQKTFSPSVFGFGDQQTSVSESQPQTTQSTVFSFASSVVSTPSTTSSSESIFGNASNLFPFSVSLAKTGSGSSIFSSASAPGTRSTTVVAPAKPGVITQTSSSSEIKSTDPFGRNTPKATTAIVFGTTALSNTPPTTTTAAIATIITTTPSITSVPSSLIIIPTPPTVSTVSESKDAVESEPQVTEDSGQEPEESVKSEEVKAVISETDSSPTVVPTKTEPEFTTPPTIFSSATPVFATATQPSSIFSVPPSTVPLGSSPASIFGVAAASSTTASIFSTPTTTTTAAASIFSPTKAVTTSSSLFGTPVAATSTASIFGQPTPTTASTGNIFGQVTPTTSTAAFGQPAKDDVGQTAKLFGDVLGSNLSSSRNIFETPASTTGSIFGKSPFEKSGGSIFGNAAATTTTTTATASPGIFGSSPSNIFSKGLGAQTQTTTSSIFGQPQNADTGNTFFGQNICNTFGGTSISSSPNQNPFASSTGFNSKPVFGQSLFGQSTTAQNPFDRSQSSSIFGGSPTTGQNVFQTSTSSFGSLPPGPFSGGQSTAGQTGIGGTSAFQKPMGGNIFGSSPTFTRSGTTPTFGGAPTFGSPATFGSPQKVFGSPQGTFGQNQANSPTFGALANQTDGFANLAMHSQSQTPAFGGNTFSPNTNFGGDTNFGGTSFSSWRS